MSKLMVCPKAKKCNNKPVWNKPIWKDGEIISYVPQLQGHCKPHNEMETCKTSSVKCPACVEVK